MVSLYVLLCDTTQKGVRMGLVRNISVLMVFLNLVFTVTQEKPGPRRTPASIKNVFQARNGCFARSASLNELKNIDIVIVDNFGFHNKCHLKPLSSKNAFNPSHGRKVLSLIKKHSKMANIVILSLNSESGIQRYEEALSLAVNLKPKFINISLAGSTSTIKETELINKAYRQGITIIAASGNKSKSVQGNSRDVCMFPGCHKKVISVGHLNKKKTNVYSLSSRKHIDYMVSIDFEEGIGQGSSFAAAYLTGFVNLKFKNKHSLEIRKELNKLSKKLFLSKHGTLANLEEHENN